MSTEQMCADDSLPLSPPLAASYGSLFEEEGEGEGEAEEEEEGERTRKRSVVLHGTVPAQLL